MASKANQARTRRIRTVILSASLLSFIPLIGVMQQGVSNSQTAVLPTAEPMAAAQLVSYSTTTAATTTAVATAETSTTGAQTVAAESKATTAAQATPVSSYTRTKAS